MDLGALIIIPFLILIAVGIVEFFVFKKNKKFSDNLAEREREAKYKMYEIAILNETSEVMGNELNAQNVVEVIINSLSDIIEYDVASYMFVSPEKIDFRVYAKNLVLPEFIGEVKEKMLSNLSELLKEDLRNKKIDEKSWGTILQEGSETHIGSFFNIPLTISGKVSGMLAVASHKPNFYKEKEKEILNKISQQATGALTRLQNIVESEKSKLNAMVASMTDGVIMTDMDFRVLVVNPAAKKAMSFENKNDLSLADFEKSLSGKIDLKDKIEEGVRLDKVFISDEISLPTGFFKIAVAPVRDAWKKLGCVIVFRDMSKEKELEKIKEDFTSMIVHELRSPLDSIKKMIELMRTSEIKKAKRTECFQMIYGSSSDMLELINNLLDIAKIEAGKFQLTKQKSDIKKLIDSRILFFGIAAKDAKVKMLSHFGKDVPDEVEFDPHTVSQVLNNLISNAVKFTKEDGMVEVQALLHKKGERLDKEAEDAGIKWFIKKDITDMPDSLVVAVTDNGIGIAPDQIDKLFNKFILAKTTFVQKGGTGLGLAISKSIIDSHGGIVGAASDEGKGSTFYFTLPIEVKA